MAEIEQAIFEDAIDAIGNMIAAENHLLESARDSKHSELFVIADEMRSQRQMAQLSLFGKNEDSSEEKRAIKSEIWCALKHVMLARVCLKEVAQKLIKKDNLEKANEFLKLADEMFIALQALRDSYELYGQA